MGNSLISLYYLATKATDFTSKHTIEWWIAILIISIINLKALSLLSLVNENK